MSPLGFDRSGGDYAAPDSKPVTGDLTRLKEWLTAPPRKSTVWRRAPQDVQDAFARVEARLVELEEICDRLINEGVDHWHDEMRVDDDSRLHEWLGLSWDEYTAWVEGRTPFDYDKKTST